MANVDLVDDRTLKSLVRLLPLDKTVNSEGHRRSLKTNNSLPKKTITGLPPLLEKYLGDFAATGLPMPYLTQIEEPQ
jgi:hypothetical protein